MRDMNKDFNKIRFIDLLKWKRLERLNRKRAKLEEYFGIEAEHYIMRKEGE